LHSASFVSPIKTNSPTSHVLNYIMQSALPSGCSVHYGSLRPVTKLSNLPWHADILATSAPLWTRHKWLPSRTKCNKLCQSQFSTRTTRQPSCIHLISYDIFKTQDILRSAITCPVLKLKFYPTTWGVGVETKYKGLKRHQDFAKSPAFDSTCV
jgi:hypothetical protein